MTELNNTLQVIIKNFLAFEISFTIRKTILISFNHHENDFLILIWTLKEILQESLFKNFLHFSIFVIILTFHIISIFILILILLLLFNFLWIFFLLFSRWIIINSIIFTLLLNFIVIILNKRRRCIVLFYIPVVFVINLLFLHFNFITVSRFWFWIFF